LLAQNVAITAYCSKTYYFNFVEQELRLLFFVLTMFYEEPTVVSINENVLVLMRLKSSIC